MIRRRVLYAVLVLCVIGVTGCATVEKLNEKTVSEENVFASPFPKFEVKIDPDLEYLGDFQETLTAHGSFYNHEVYFFGQIEDDVYTRGILFDFRSLPSDLVWKGNPDLESEGALDSGQLDWGETQVPYLIIPGNPFSEKDKEFLSEKGYALPPCFMLKISARQQAWARVYALYFEPLPSCREQWNSAQLTADQQKFLDTFKQQSMRDMIFQ